MNLQAFLRAGGKPEDLLVPYAITAKRHREFPNLVLFKYSMIDSPMGEPIVRECRGVILDEANDWAVVSRAFDKFFNHGEGHAAPIDWSTARVQEKLDGSLCVLYAYAGKWHVATSGTPDASGDVHGTGGSFADYFWATFKAQGGELPGDEHADVCFAFELCGPNNRIVVVHAEPKLTLLAARNRESGVHYPPETFADRLKIHAVRSFPLSSFDGIAETFAAMSPLAQEGYVVVDGAFNRVKVKHPGYVALHHAKDGMGPKAFLQIARAGETSEVAAAFPEFAPMIAKARTDVDAIVARIESSYAPIQHIPEQKAFALEAVKTGVSAALFCLRAKKTESARAFVRDMPIDKLIELIGGAS